LARSRRGTWALYPIGPEVVVVHPDGAVSGLPAEVAAEVGRLAARDRQGELDRQAAKTIQQLLTGDGLDRAGPRRRGARTWVIPAKAYWISGPYNDHGQPATRMPDHAAASHSNDHGIDPAIHAAPPPAQPARRQPVRCERRWGCCPSRDGDRVLRDTLELAAVNALSPLSAPCPRGPCR
jgi:hypothetical protein